MVDGEVAEGEGERSEGDGNVEITRELGNISACIDMVSRLYGRMKIILL